MPAKTKDEMIASIERIANTVVQAAGLELFDVELKGSGRSHYLRVYIDRPGKPAAPDQPEGVTLEDCENVSREMSALLDTEDPIPGTYSLEVSSPGVERPLKRWKDWERFVGQKAKVVLKEPVEEKLKSFDGTITQTSEPDQTLTMEIGKGRSVTFPFSLVSKAHLKFEW